MTSGGDTHALLVASGGAETETHTVSKRATYWNAVLFFFEIRITLHFQNIRMQINLNMRKASCTGDKALKLRATFPQVQNAL